MSTGRQTQRPDEVTAAGQAGGSKKPVGYQSWHDLLFVHWRVPADVCQRLLPARLAVDTWQGSAWIGLVAFHMSGVRPRWFPAIPYVSRFPETNLRTYVRSAGNEPGIWFFSLEAARLPAVLAARAGWQLPYHWARMRVKRQCNRVRYTSRRLLDRGGAGASIVAEVEPAGDPGDMVDTSAAPGTLEEFLIERYVFYNLDRRGQLQQGRVRHRPYPLRAARWSRSTSRSTPPAGWRCRARPSTSFSAQASMSKLSAGERSGPKSLETNVQALRPPGSTSVDRRDFKTANHPEGADRRQDHGNHQAVGGSGQFEHQHDRRERTESGGG